MKKLSVSIAALFYLFAGAAGQDSMQIKSLPEVTVTAATTKVPNRIWKGFSTYFAQAEYPRWYKVNKDYLVKFMVYDEDNRALFSKRGSMIYHITYGYENMLPDEVYKQVRSAYFDYDITRAIRIAEHDRVIWVMNIEDKNTLIIVRLENGEVEEIHRYKKQDNG